MSLASSNPWDAPSNTWVAEQRLDEAQAPASHAGAASRIHYLDNLRALAMLLGVFLHAALAYAVPAQSVWLATDPNGSVLIDASIWFIHLFRMALFFLLSGYFAKLVIERKGLKHFIGSRGIRIVGPFVLFYPFLYMAMGIIIVFALSYLESPKGIMGMIAAAVKDTTVTQKREPPGTMHLWFLYYLMAFSALGAMLYNVKWLRLDKLFHYPVLWILGPMVLVPGAFAGGTPLAAPESFMPHWWPFAFYGVFYFGGWCLYGKEKLLEAWCPYAWYLVMLCVVLYVPYYIWMPILELKDIVAGIPSQPFWLRCVEALFTAYLSTFLTLAALLLGKRYLSRKSGLLSFLADSSYWVYLLHLPIVLFLQTLLVPLAIPMWIKFAIVLAGTLISCFVTYVVFVRYTPVGWLLHGKRTFP